MKKMKNVQWFKFILIVSSVLIFSGLLGCTDKSEEKTKPEEKTAVKKTIKNPDTFIYVDYGTVRTLDPAVCYDVVGRQKLKNIYETLIYFDGSSTDKFVPVLATTVPTIENGGISPDGKTYKFQIRKNVKFHNGAVMTPEDVVYSFKRNMICDSAGGPMWMLIEALTGEGGTRDDGKIIPGIFDKIDRAVEAKGDEIIFHLPAAYPPFLSIMTYTTSVVLNKKWCIENNCWDGNIANAAKYNRPAPGYEPLQKIENGTAPYFMKSWVPSKEFVFERFDSYWGPKPQLKYAVFKYVKEWSTRKLMLQNGDADRAMVDLNYVPEVRQMSGLTLYEVPQLDYSAALFCQKINSIGNPNIGSGKLDGEGIPPDFFADINVRKAFLHAMDRKTYKNDVFNGLVVMPTSPNVEGLPYHKDVPVYAFDLEKSKEFMKKAWDGKAWEKGFKMIITHNTGNEMRQAAAHMLAENIASLNPKFQIEVRNVDWKDYTVKYRQFEFPIFIIGWSADYADPHNFMYTFMHSKGVYGSFMAYKNEEVDKLCSAGIKTVDPLKRQEIYSKLQDLWYIDAIGIPLYQSIDLRAYKNYISGFVPNAIDSPAMEHLAHIRKQ
ncbi:MAG: ABC transporter substrate-binding protein [Desulfobacteraceae bacterium]|nr:ABC transporter substrate-binding protein [Desulfobacteraceae bacterium]